MSVFFFGVALSLQGLSTREVDSFFGDLCLLADSSTDFLGELTFNIFDFNLSCLLFLIIRLKPNFCVIERLTGSNLVGLCAWFWRGWLFSWFVAGSFSWVFSKKVCPNIETYSYCGCLTFSDSFFTNGLRLPMRLPGEQLSKILPLNSPPDRLVPRLPGLRRLTFSWGAAEGLKALRPSPEF